MAVQRSLVETFEERHEAAQSDSRDVMIQCHFGVLGVMR
jgi:hypothetical protein